jgi:hypothetical protein
VPPAAPKTGAATPRSLPPSKFLQQRPGALLAADLAVSTADRRSPARQLSGRQTAGRRSPPPPRPALPEQASPPFAAAAANIRRVGTDRDHAVREQRLAVRNSSARTPTGVRALSSARRSRSAPGRRRARHWRPPGSQPGLLASIAPVASLSPQRGRRGRNNRSRDKFTAIITCQCTALSPSPQRKRAPVERGVVLARIEQCVGGFPALPLASGRQRKRSRISGGVGTATAMHGEHGGGRGGAIKRSRTARHALCRVGETGFQRQFASSGR